MNCPSCNSSNIKGSWSKQNWHICFDCYVWFQVVNDKLSALEMSQKHDAFSLHIDYINSNSKLIYLHKLICTINDVPNTNPKEFFDRILAQKMFL